MRFWVARQKGKVARAKKEKAGNKVHMKKDFQTPIAIQALNQPGEVSNFLEVSENGKNNKFDSDGKRKRDGLDLELDTELEKMLEKVSRSPIS